MDISIGLVRQVAAAGIRWLAVWDATHKHYRFVVADRLEGELRRETITREVAWQLNLDRHREFLVSNMAQANLEFEGVVPGEITPRLVRATFYNVEIFRETAKAIINANRECRWMTSQEICEGVAVDGRALDPLLVFLVNQSQVIQPWESLPRESH